LVQIESAVQPDRIGRRKSSDARIIVPVAVVMQPRLFVNLLPLKPCALARRDAERLGRRVVCDRLTTSTQ
jgi:hypothetical protein